MSAWWDWGSAGDWVSWLQVSNIRGVRVLVPGLTAGFRCRFSFGVSCLRVNMFYVSLSFRVYCLLVV